MYQGQIPINPYFGMMNSNYNQPAMQQQQIIRVHGREGAKAYQLAPNSSILLLDDSNPILWFKSTDGAGYSTEIPYDLSPHVEQQEIVVPQQQTQTQPQYDISALEKRISKLERRLNNNGKPGTGRYGSSQKFAEPAEPAEPATDDV